MTALHENLLRDTTYCGMRVRRVDLDEWAVMHPAHRLTIRLTPRGAFYLLNEAGEIETIALSIDSALNRALELYGQVRP